MSQPGIEPGPPQWEAITPEKSYVNSYYGHPYNQWRMIARISKFLEIFQGTEMIIL
jgi:hypothetical protein